MVFLMKQNEAVGPAVHMMRTSAGLTMEQLSQIAGVSLSYLSQVESNKKHPSQAWVYNLAVAIAGHAIQRDARAGYVAVAS